MGPCEGVRGLPPRSAVLLGRQRCNTRRVSDDEPFLDPDGASEMLSHWAGNVLGRFALDETSVSDAELYEAVGVSLVMNAKTEEEVFDPRNAFIVDLFCTP